MNEKLHSITRQLKPTESWSRGQLTRVFLEKD